MLVRLAIAVIVVVGAVAVTLGLAMMTVDLVQHVWHG